MNFARYPQSIPELRVESSDDFSEWTPRDVLIHILRKIDSGEIAPDTMVIGWYRAVRPEGEEELTPGWRVAYKSHVALAGLCSMLSNMIGRVP